MDRLAQLRAFAQSKRNAPAPIGYPQLPLQQPPDFLSWPWIKQKKLFSEYLHFDRNTALIKDVKIDYSPLLWCHQARTEALKFFCEDNYLIRITVFAQEGEDLRKGIILNPADQLRVPTELFDEEMFETLQNGITLHLQFGQGCGTEQPNQSTNCVYDAIFGFQKSSWAEYCQILATNTVRVYPGVTVNLHTRHRSNFRDLVPDVLLQLSHFRFAENIHFVGVKDNPFFTTLASAMSANPTNAWQWHDLLLGLIEEAGFRAKTDFHSGYVFMCRAYTIAEIALATSLYLGAEAGLVPVYNGTLALCTKVFIIYAWASYLLIEANVSDGQYPPGVYPALDKMYMTIRNARTWPGMSNRQMAGVHFVTGLFYEHLAGYLATPANIEYVQTMPYFPHELNVTSHRKQAAHCFYVAAQLNPPKFGAPAMKRWDALYDKFGQGVAKEVFQVKIETVETVEGGSWTGWKVMWDAWGIEKLAYLESMRNKHVSVMSKSQVKRLRERLGLGNCRKEPAGLLRCLAE